LECLQLAHSRLWADGKIAEPTGKDRLQLSGIFNPIHQFEGARFK
jgi:hypothetical protein